MGDAVELRGVAVDPDGGKPVSEIDLRIAAGEIVGLVGEAGVTSTIGRLAAGVLEPAAGTVLIDGIPATGRNPDALRRACFLGAVNQRWTARRILAGLYPGWDQERYRALCARWELGRFSRRWRVPAAYDLGALGFSTGAPLVAILPELRRGRSWDAEALAELVAAAREVGCALLVADARADVLAPHVDRLERVSEGASVPVPDGHTSVPAAPGEVGRLVRLGMRPGAMALVELGVLAWFAWLAAGTLGGVFWGWMLPMVLFGLWIPLWHAGWWSPVSAIGGRGAWDGLGGSLPASGDALFRARWLVAAARSTVPVLFVVWLARDVPVVAFLEGMSMVPLLGFLVVVGLVWSPLSAALPLARPHQLALTVAASLLLIGGPWLAARGAWVSPRLWHVALTSPEVLGVTAASGLLGGGWILLGLKNGVLGAARGRRTWTWWAVAGALALTAGVAFVVRDAMPEPDWRDGKFGGVLPLDERTLLLTTQEPPPGGESLLLVDVETWEASTLPEGVVHVTWTGERWGRLVTDGTRRWMELSSTLDGPAVATSLRWPGSEGTIAWDPVPGLLVGADGPRRRVWLSLDGATGSAVRPDERTTWVFRRHQGELRLVRRDQRVCPDGVKPEGGWSVYWCGDALVWDRDEDPGTPPVLLPPLPIQADRLVRPLPGADGRFVLRGTDGTYVLTLAEQGWTQVRMRVDGQPQLPLWMGPDRVLVQGFGGLRVGSQTTICDASTGVCAGPPLR